MEKGKSSEPVGEKTGVLLPGISSSTAGTEAKDLQTRGPETTYFCHFLLTGGIRRLQHHLNKQEKSPLIR